MSYVKFVIKSPNVCLNTCDAVMKGFEEWYSAVVVVMRMTRDWVNATSQYAELVIVVRKEHAVRRNASPFLDEQVFSGEDLEDTVEASTSVLGYLLIFDICEV